MLVAHCAHWAVSDDTLHKSLIQLIDTDVDIQCKYVKPTAPYSTKGNKSH